ncbi:hypothetical protein R1sor_006442 [Riccia sorocarpa]|uniref:Uncharacterized protein n=1 Tax=Riccia sorocarpa TaxID=122646 RepID=A0ABD3HPC7_9MARC
METIAALAAPSSLSVSAVAASSLRPIERKSVQRNFSCRYGNVMISSGIRRSAVLRKRRDPIADAELRFGIKPLQVKRSSSVAAQSQDSAGNEVKVEEAAKELEEQAEESKAAYNEAVDTLKDEALKVEGAGKSAFDPAAAEKAIEVLRDTTEKLKGEAEKARAILTATALETAELGKTNLNLLAEAAPEGPIKEVAETAVNVHLSESPKKGAKIHDFCLGIPYGGLLVGGGLFWFILTGSTAAIRFGVILGGALLFLSITSLKIWKQGRSSLPYIQGQAALTAIIFIRDSRRYLGGGGFFPTAVSALASGAMLAFYAYVYLSGGNPPKKEKAAGSAAAA